MEARWAETASGPAIRAADSKEAHARSTAASHGEGWRGDRLDASEGAAAHVQVSSSTARVSAT